MSNESLVSIGLTTYNRPAHLKHAFRKLTNQTYKNIEIIVADDNPGSEENFLVYKNNFKTDARIRYYKKEVNEGMNLNFTFALSKAKGKFFMWAADDDDWNDEFIANCVKHLEANENALLAISKVQFIDQEYNVVGESSEDIDTQGLQSNDRFKKYFLNSQVHNVGFYGLYNTEALKKSYLPNYLSNDRLVLLELTTKGEFIQFDSEGFYYNVSGSSKGIKSYLLAMKIESKLIEHMPHLAFNLLHIKAILFKWKGLNPFTRITYLLYFIKLIKSTGYLMFSFLQVRDVIKSQIRKHILIK